MLAAAQHLALCGRHGLQRFNGGLGLALLHDAEHRVEQHDREDDEHLREALARERVRHRGHRRRSHQNEQHRILQLLEKALEKRSLRRLLQLVRPVPVKARGGLLCRQAGRRGVKRRQYVLRGLLIRFLHGSVSFFVDFGGFRQKEKTHVRTAAVRT